MSQAGYTRFLSVAPSDRSAVGFVIGKGGSNIARIRDATGVRWVSYERGQSQFKVVGTPRAVEAAIKEIDACLDEGFRREQEHAQRQRDYNDRRRERERRERESRAPRTQKVPTNSDFPTLAAKKSGFGALKALEGKTIDEFEQGKIRAREDAERKALVEDEEMTQQWLSASNFRQAEEERASRMKTATEDFAKRDEQWRKFEKIESKKSNGTDDVWGGNGASRLKAKTAPEKFERKIQRSNATHNITEAVITGGGVDLVELKRHNREVSKKEQEAWQARKDAREAQQTKKKETASKRQEESKSASPEIVAPDRPISRTSAKNTKRKQNRAEEKARIDAAYPDHVTIEIPATSESPDPLAPSPRPTKKLRLSVEDKEYMETNLPRFYAEWAAEIDRAVMGADVFGGPWQGNKHLDGGDTMTEMDESNIDNFLENLPSGWGVAA